MTLFLLLLSFFLVFCTHITIQWYMHQPATWRYTSLNCTHTRYFRFFLFGSCNWCRGRRVRCRHSCNRLLVMFRFQLVAKTFIRDIWSHSDSFEPMVRDSVLIVHRSTTESSNMQFGPNCTEEMNRLGCWRVRC